MFLQKLNKTNLNELDYSMFIFEVFKNKAESQVELTHLTFDKHRNYKVNYKFYKSLNSFLSKKDILIDFTSRSDQSELYENRREFFQSFKAECENFIDTISKKHNIAAISEDNLTAIRQKFVKDSWKRYLWIYSGQFIALLIAIPLFLLIYAVGSHNLHISKDWKFYKMNPTQYYSNYNRQIREKKVAEQNKIAEQKRNVILAEKRRLAREVEIHEVKFFESGQNDTEYKKRKYNEYFSKNTTRYINFEITTWGYNWETSDQKLNINYKFLRPNGETLHSGTISSNIVPYAAYGHKFGYDSPNKWEVGRYRVDLAIEDRSIGSYYFSIN
jgi:hypothetical protein